MTTAPVTAGLRAVGREARRRLRLTPRFRGRELTLLAIVAIALVVEAAAVESGTRP